MLYLDPAVSGASDGIMCRSRVHDLGALRFEITDPSPPASTALRAADRAYQAALDDLTRQAGLAA